MSAGRNQRKKTRRAARDLLNQGATMAQLDRLFRRQMISVRVYDKLINPLLEADPGRRKEGEAPRKNRSIKLDEML